MELESTYLKKALVKAGLVVIVKTFYKDRGKSKLEYISPNADIVGMNVELLSKGLKLTEDYIHPEDREKVISIARDAYAEDLGEYTHEYRLVGDDGRIYSVVSETTITPLSDTSYRMEVYIRTGSAAVRAQRVEPKSDADEDVIDRKTIKEVADADKLPFIIKGFSKLCGLYSVMVDLEGKPVYPPTGPAANLGDFYDLLERPEYKEYYNKLYKLVEEADSEVVVEREEGGEGRISAVPIKVNGQMRGVWLIGSYTKEETDKLRHIAHSQWTLAEMMSDYLTKSIIIEVESAKSRGAGIKLREELARQSIINEALSKINSKLIDNVDQVIEETLRDVGVHMDIDKILLYTDSKSKQGELVLRNYWSYRNEPLDSDIEVDFPKKRAMYQKIMDENNGLYIADRSSLTETSKLNLMRYNMKALIGFPIRMNDKNHGMIFFVESKSERVWPKEEIRFARSISMIIQNMIENAEGDDNIRNVNKHLIETYNNFNMGIFVRDAFSGEVLFSNEKMNSLMGRDFTGGNSKELLTDLHDRFDNISGMRKPFITNNKVATWRKYIQKLDMIMDITEINIEWLNGEPASLVMLRKAKDEILN